MGFIKRSLMMAFFSVIVSGGLASAGNSLVVHNDTEVPVVATIKHYDICGINPSITCMEKMVTISPKANYNVPAEGFCGILSLSSHVGEFSFSLVSNEKETDITREIYVSSFQKYINSTKLSGKLSNLSVRLDKLQHKFILLQESENIVLCSGLKERICFLMSRLKRVSPGMQISYFVTSVNNLESEIGHLESF